LLHLVVEAESQMGVSASASRMEKDRLLKAGTVARTTCTRSSASNRAAGDQPGASLSLRSDGAAADRMAEVAVQQLSGRRSTEPVAYHLHSRADRANSRHSWRGCIRCGATARRFCLTLCALP
jgi:hypothetical protein